MIGTGHIHPKEQRNYERGCIAKQLRRIHRRDARKMERLRQSLFAVADVILKDKVRQ